MSLRELLKNKLLSTSKQALRTLIERVLEDEEGEEDDLHPGHQRGELTYTFAGQFMEGTDLRSMLSGAAAFTSIWVRNDEEVAHLDGELLLPGPYHVTVKMDVVFEPFDVEAAQKERDELDDIAENGIPVYEARDLISVMVKPGDDKN